jgi:hypothetical protein
MQAESTGRNGNKYMTVTDIREEVKGRIISGNACYYSV